MESYSIENCQRKYRHGLKAPRRGGVGGWGEWGGERAKQQSSGGKQRQCRSNLAHP